MSDVDDDIADLVGDTPRQRRAARSTPAETLDNLARSRRNNRDHESPLVENMIGGVTVSWLAQVFGMDPKTVKQRLAECPPLHRRKGGFVYHLAVAAQYLVKPALSPQQFMKNMKPSDLPAAYQSSFWQAQLARQKWEENAGDLWRTEQVREVLGSTFQTIKFQLQLWADTVEQQAGLDEDQRSLLTGLIDLLQTQIYEALVKNSKRKRTRPQSSEIDELVNEGSSVDENDGMELV